MKLTTIYRSDVGLDARRPSRPPHLRQPDFDALYEYNVLFYDVFYRNGRIVLTGPPLEEVPHVCARIVLNGRSLYEAQPVVVQDRKTILFIVDGFTARPDIAVNGAAVQVEDRSAFDAGNRVFYTLQKNNEIAWIREWIEFNATHHKPSGFIIYDNGSDRYSIDELQRVLKLSFENTQVYSLPFQHGPISFKDSAWDSDYLQYCLYDHVRHSFFDAGGMLVNTDIDELVVDVNIFDALAAASTAVLSFRGVWAYRAAGARLPDMASFYDHTVRSAEASVSAKWAVDISRLNFDARLMVHEVKRATVSQAPFPYVHFQEISTNWRYRREKRVRPADRGYLPLVMNKPHGKGAREVAAGRMTKASAPAGPAAKSPHDDPGHSIQGGGCPRIPYIAPKRLSAGTTMNIREDADGRREYEHGPPLEGRVLDARSLFARGEYGAARRHLDGISDAIAGVSNVEHFGGTHPAPRASVVVLSHRHSPLVAAGLEELARQATEEIEVVLVDTGNGDLLQAAKSSLRRFVHIKPPFPPGCSGGRNVGAFFARAPYLIFLEDDGVMEPNCLPALIGALEETGAIAARGKMAPLAGKTQSPAHYDLGPHRIPAFITCEGISIWRRDAFRQAGGFDLLLAGHEGVELCGRLWRFFGPGAFVYEPGAVLRHDYADSTEHAQVKKARYDENRKYVEVVTPGAFRAHETTVKNPGTGRTLSLATRLLAPDTVNPSSAPAVSVITTARNAAGFVDEFTRAWKAQTAANFQLVFVDDGSEDGTADAVRRAWHGDRRLVLLERPFRGRGASLNTALDAADHEICLIADADDISLPGRIAGTQRLFLDRPEADFLSFLYFTEDSLFRIGQPYSPFGASMSVRPLFGMPVGFPAFAFRKGSFPLPFNEELRGGLDCDWMHRNLEKNPGLRGELVQTPMVYYRRHEAQITRLHSEQQQEARVNLMQWAFARVIGELSETDKKMIHLLVDGRKANRADRRLLSAWVGNAINRNDREKIYCPEAFARALSEAFDLVKIVPDQFADLCRIAEESIAKKEFVRARRTLRKALDIKDDPLVRRRLAATNKFWIVRKLSRSRPLNL